MSYTVDASFEKYRSDAVDLDPDKPVGPRSSRDFV